MFQCVAPDRGIRRSGLHDQFLQMVGMDDDLHACNLRAAELLRGDAGQVHLCDAEVSGSVSNFLARSLSSSDVPARGNLGALLEAMYARNSEAVDHRDRFTGVFFQPFRNPFSAVSTQIFCNERLILDCVELYKIIGPSL